MITVIIPTFNEMRLGYLQKNLEQLSQIKNIEIICVDSFSSDGTAELINKYPQVKLIKVETNSRAVRYNTGINYAANEMILLNHPRSIVSPKGIEYLKQCKHDWGGFTHKFDASSALLNFTSWYSNNIRANLKNIFYLDHCIFAKKELLQIVGLIPTVDIFEDTLLCKRLKKYHKGTLIPFEVITSAIRFKTNGIIRQALLNQILKLAFNLKLPNRLINLIYEKGINLNSQY